MSTGNHSPCGLSWRLRSSSTMPGSTVHARVLDVEIEDAREIFRAIDDQRFADGLAGLRRAAAARQDGRALAAGNRYRPIGLLDRARRDHADRHDLVVGGIGCVAAARKTVELNLAGQFGLQPPLQTGHDNGHVFLSFLGCAKPMHKD